MDCVFCKIVAGSQSAVILYQDELVTAFRDSHPAAPTHILIVPNRHLVSVNEVSPDDEPALGRLFSVASQLAKREGIQETGYRLIVNTGPYAGQAVFHLHLHLLGGQRMKHPMG